MLSGTAIPLASRVKKLREGLKAHTYNESCSSPSKIERTVVENEGRKVGEYVTVDGEVTQSSSTPDARMAEVKMGKDGTLDPSSPSGAVDQMNESDEAKGEKEENVSRSLTKSIQKLRALRR